MQLTSTIICVILGWIFTLLMYNMVMLGHMRLPEDVPHIIGRIVY